MLIPEYDPIGQAITDFYYLSSTLKYDTLLFLMNGTGMAGTMDMLAGFLRKSKELLNPNGQVLLDSSNIQYIFESMGDGGSSYVLLNQQNLCFINGNLRIIVLGAGLLFLIPVFLIFLQSYAWYTGYYVLENGLVLRGVYKKETILYKNISGIKILSENETRTLLEEPMEKAANRGREGDLKGWYKENKRYSELLKYCTVQFSHSAAGSYSYKSEQYTGVKLQDDLGLVLLEHKDGRKYVLSPKRPEEFISLIISKRELGE
ncbi:MAG: hypothetical protein PF693_02900 [Spirochaetia bacterium]|jgi:hypothetical protein|nr:hypothetical protein [Spirochaetia bacterium]